MTSAPATVARLHPGTHVALQGTRIVGDVKRIHRSDGRDRVTLKVTAVVGKSRTSKKARAWQGAWVTCTPEMVMLLH